MKNKKIQHVWISLWKRDLSILFILVVSAQLFSQTIEQLGTEDGLSNNYLTSIVQDKDGFVWLSTAWGLNRFNGTSFDVFKANPMDSCSLAGNGINRLLYDTKRNCIWIATKRDGLCRYNCESQHFFSYPVHADKKNAIKSNGICDISFDTNGDLWLATYGNGLKKLLVQQDSVVHYGHLSGNGIADYYYYSVTDGGDGTVYLGYVNNGWSVFRSSDNSVKHYVRQEGNNNAFPGISANATYIDSHGNVWVGTECGLALYCAEKDCFIVFRHNPSDSGSLINDVVMQFAEINGELWIGTAQGISILDLSQDLHHVEHVKFGRLTAENQNSVLADKTVMTLFQDSFHNI